jgi:hypothetical protein
MAKGVRKKQSISGQRRQREKTGAGPETGAGVSNIPVSQIFHKKALVSRADWLKAMKRASREETELNKESPNSSFFFGANAKLGELFRRAKKGDADAARLLLGFLIYNVGEFEKFCSSKIRIAKHIVVVGESWPLLHTDLKANKDGALTIPLDHVLRKLGVVRGKRRYNLDTAIGTSIAATLYNQMEFYRHTAPPESASLLVTLVEREADAAGMHLMRFYRHTARQGYWDKSQMALKAAIDRIIQLEPLSPSNYPAWWKAAELLFIWQWSKEFQDHRNFENWNTKGYSELEPHLVRSAKRRDIKRAIKQGFESLANSLRDRVLN